MKNAALTTPENVGNLPLRERIAIARNSGLIPPAVRTDEAAALILIKAYEFNVPWTQAFSAFHVINGVCSCGAQFMLAKAYERLKGFEFEILETDSDQCSAKMRRSPKHAWITIGYTFKQAQQAGLAAKANWKNHPDDMLRNRVVSKLLKMVAPDVFMGIYTEDEAESIKSIPHEEIGDATAARRVATRLGVEPPPAHEPPPADAPPEADPPEPPGDVVDVDPEPPGVPATADWEQAIDAADGAEALGLALGQIMEDARLDARQRLSLRRRAAGVALARGLGAEAWLALVEASATSAEIKERFLEIKEVSKSLAPADRNRLRDAMRRRAGELAALEAGGTEGD